jgi:hypothetical protein
MSSEQRAKLDTAIEREVHKFIQGISESLYDRLNIYVRRNEVPIDMDVFNALVKTMQASITEFEMKGIDQFHTNIKKELDLYAGEENPTTKPQVVAPSVKSSSVPVATTASSKKKVKSATFSV